MSDLIIEVGKFYKTRDGRKARIYATDGTGGWEIHGARLSSYGWVICYWRSNGSALQYSSDLISPWIDPPVVAWDRLPKHIVAVAMDKNNSWYGYAHVPREENSTWFSDEAYSGTWGIYPEHTPAFTGDWRDSLAVRPGCGE